MVVVISFRYEQSKFPAVSVVVGCMGRSRTDQFRITQAVGRQKLP
jgi:hypothetical protein